MKSDRMILWCSKQKTGIRMEKPNDLLCKSYLKEANDALVSMNANMKAGLKKWAIITAYYARYNAIYALLSKTGIKSEIHDCSITLIRYLFPDLFDSKFFEELEISKQQRIDVQYYTNRTISDPDYDKNVKSVSDFVLSVEKVAGEIGAEKIAAAREKLTKGMRGSK